MQPEDKNAWMELAGLLDDRWPKNARRWSASSPSIPSTSKPKLSWLDWTARPASCCARPRCRRTRTLFCANHPNRQTMLRCNKCNKPICTECSVRTPVGYRCKECVRGLQDKFYTATTSNQAVGYAAAALAGLLLGVAAFLFGACSSAAFSASSLLFSSARPWAAAWRELILRATGRKRARNFNRHRHRSSPSSSPRPSRSSPATSFVGLILVGLAASTLYARLR